MTGKVWLVGAGPGDAGLFTLKGKEVLEKADVVVYDALVGQGVLSMIPDSSERIFAGKRSGHHFLKQDETNRVLLEKALEGKRVVRLKGGDPFLFGRGGEELELLSEHGVPFEIVPGITSAFAVPAYNGIPVTHRDFCSSVHIITGHKRADHEYDIDFRALADTKGTLIFLMGISALSDITSGLLKAGMDPKTPAAVLEQGTTADQHRIEAALKDLADVCSRTKVHTPAIIVVGRVTTLSREFAWYEKLPLFGIRVVVTRPKELISEMSAMLRKEGAEVLEIPAIGIVPVKDMQPIHDSIRALESGNYDWIVFTSSNGVRIFFEEICRVSDLRALSGTKIAVIGRGTEKELKKRGLRPDFIPSVYDGETLGRELADICGENTRFLIPRAAIGNPELPERLRAVPGAKVDDVAVYDTIYESDPVVDITGDIENGDIDFAVFTSASTVEGFAKAFKDADLSAVNAICIGKQTEAKARQYNMKTRTAKAATLQAVVDCVREAAEEKKKCLIKADHMF